MSDGFGLTKREYFAGLAMQAIINGVGSQPNVKTLGPDWVAKNAVEFADGLLRKLEK